MEITNKLVAVTGATGFLGAYLVRSLHRAGARVRAVVRSPEKAAFLRTMLHDVERADLLDRASLVRALSGCEALVSNAGLWTLKWTPTAEFHDVNVRGVENLMEAAAEAGVKRVVHIGTFGVYQWTLRRTMGEDTPLVDGKPWDGAYRNTKAEGEKRAWALAKAHGLDLTVLRPTAIYGAREEKLLPWLRRLLRLPVAPVPSTTVPMVYAGDVAQAVVGALANDRSIGHAYNTGGEPVPFADFAKALRSVDPKARARVIALPGALGLRVDNAAAHKDLGFTNRPFAEGLRQTLDEERSGIT